MTVALAMERESAKLVAVCFLEGECQSPFHCAAVIITSPIRFLPGDSKAVDQIRIGVRPARRRNAQLKTVKVVSLERHPERLFHAFQICCCRQRFRGSSNRQVIDDYSFLLDCSMGDATQLNEFVVTEVLHA